MWNRLRSIHQALGIKYRFDRVVGYVRRFGVRPAFRTHRRIWTQHGGELNIFVPGLSHQVLIRAGTADASTFEKIFIWNDYNLEFPANVKSIVDAGANIGLSAVYFADRFPSATVIAIEPEPENFRLLEHNVAPYANIVPLRAALWGSDATLGLSNPGAPVDSFRYTQETADGAVRALSVPSILSSFGMNTVDVFKIDIEGAESDVFARLPAWVDRVGMFIVELHNPAARETFMQATASLNATRYKHGEDDVVLVK